MKVLNLYAGIGGNRKLWTDVEVTAVEYDPKIAAIYKDIFPNDNVIVTDAHQYLLEHIDEYEFIWASPPCPTHSKLQTMIVSNTHKISYPDMKLYQEIIILKNWFRNKFVVENVKPYYNPLIRPDAELHRHLFWTNFGMSKFNTTDERKHNEIKNTSTVYGFNLTKYDIKDKVKLLRNMVDPELGLHLFNHARNIIKSQDVNQLEIF